jgi:integrase
MATVNFLYRSTKDKANLILRLLYRYNENDFVIGVPTKLEVEKNYWNNLHKKKSKKIEINNLQIDVNKEINKIENFIISAFNSVRIDEVNKDWLKKKIEYYYNPSKETQSLPMELLKYFDYFIESKKNDISKGTQKKYNVTKQLLRRYESTLSNSTQIVNVNDKFRIDFENYCLRQNYALNTISKDLRTIKTVCNHAKYNGLEISHQLDSIKTPQHKTEKIYLTFIDLEKIEKIDIRRLNDNYTIAKDWLIISCYTGQRISDFMRFDKSMIRYEKNKIGDLKPFIEFTQVKTNKLMTVALHPKVVLILEKRNGNFPQKISDPKYNLFIKQVCRIAELNEPTKGSKLEDFNKENELLSTIKGMDNIKKYRKKTGIFKKWELITSHVGRKSFASNFYGEIPTTLLINVLGHSTESMFLNYIGKSDKTLAMEVANYF